MRRVGSARRPLRLLIVGRGRLGSSVARALRGRGAEVTLWSGRGRWPSRVPAVDGVWLAVGDPFLPAVTARLAASRLGRTTPVLHASGALGPSALAALAPRPCGAMHPLLSFAGRAREVPAEATAVLAGDRAAVTLGRRIAAALAWRVVERPLHGPGYHAAAAMLANGAAALAHEAVRMLRARGVDERAAERAAAGLLRSVADQVASVGVPGALTGPIARGDAATVRAHRAALGARERAAYDALAPLILGAAIDAGLSRTAARAVRAALHQKKK